MTRQPVTIHYRRLEDVTNAFRGLTLERSIRQAMNTVSNGAQISGHWAERAWVVPPSQDETLLMNVYQDGGHFFFGDLTQYTRGFLQALLAEMEDAPMLPVEQEPPPDGKEYVHSMMYWLAVGNHILMAQSRSLTGKQLEQYLSWLLKDKTAAITQTGHVMLQAKFDAEEVGGDLEDISEIIVGGTATPIAPVELPPEAREQEHEVTVYREIAEERAWPMRAYDVLRAVMNNDADVQRLLESIPTDADLQVSVHIGYRTRRRRVTRAPMQQALRNLPEGEIIAKGKHGRLTGRDIRLSYPARIAKTGSLLDLEDVLRALREAYAYFVENGKIEP